MSEKDRFLISLNSTRMAKLLDQASVWDKINNSHIEKMFQPTGIEKWLGQPSVWDKINNSHIEKMFQPTGIEKWLGQPSVWDKINNSHIEKMFQPTGIEKWLGQPSEVDMSTISDLVINEGLLRKINEESIKEILGEFEFLKEESVKSSDSLSDSIIDESSRNIMEILNEKSDGLFKMLETLRQKRAFLYLIFTVIISLALPIVGEIYKDKVLDIINYQTHDPKQNIKEIKKELSIEFEDYTHYLNITRITTRETDVFRSSSKKSGKIDSIPSNRPVIIIMKKKNWSLVVYRNEESIDCTGWVFTGNLLK